MRILFLSCWFPCPPINGSKLRVFNLLRALSQRHEVTLLAFADRPDADPAAPALASLCRGIEVVPATPFRPQSRLARIGYLSRTPRSLVDGFSKDMKDRIVRHLADEAYDVIIASQTAMAVYAPHFGRTPALLEEVELGVLAAQRHEAPTAWQRRRHALTWWKHRHYVARQLRYFHACTVASERERQLLSTIAPSYEAIHVVPNCVDLADYDVPQPPPVRQTVIFTGSLTYEANHDAMQWFVREVYPRILERMPEVQLTITGEHAGISLTPAAGLRLTGVVRDVRPLVAASWISLAPLRVGGGTRLKILEAMALGTPVVATSKGAEGLEVVDGEHLLIADSPAAFAEQVVRLLADAGLRDRLQRRARQLVAERYDARHVLPQFERLVEQVAGSGGRRA